MSTRRSFGLVCEKVLYGKNGGGLGKRGGLVEERRRGWSGGGPLFSQRLLWHMFCIRLIQIPWRRDKSVTLSICFCFCGVEGWGRGRGCNRLSSPADKKREEKKMEKNKKKKAKSVMSVLSRCGNMTSALLLVFFILPSLLPAFFVFVSCCGYLALALHATMANII